VGERRTLSPSKSNERCAGVLPASGVGVDGQIIPERDDPADCPTSWLSDPSAPNFGRLRENSGRSLRCTLEELAVFHDVVPRTLPQLLARRVVIVRDCLGSVLVARKACEADVVVQDLECFCEAGVRVWCVVGRSVGFEPLGVVVVLFSAFAITQKSEGAAGRYGVFAAVGSL
jgi:hypothetical protein